MTDRTCRLALAALLSRTVTAARQPLHQYGTPEKGSGDCDSLCRLGEAFVSLSTPLQAGGSHAITAVLDRSVRGAATGLRMRLSAVCARPA